MRLFAEEKRQGTIELLVTSPITDVEIVIGKWLAAVLMYASLLAVLAFDVSFLFIYGSPDWKPVASGFLGLLLLGATLLAFRRFHFHADQESNRCRGRWIRFCAFALGFELGYFTRRFRDSPRAELSIHRQPHGWFFARRRRYRKTWSITSP